MADNTQTPKNWREPRRRGQGQGQGQGQGSGRGMGQGRRQRLRMRLWDCLSFRHRQTSDDEAQELPRRGLRR